MGERWFRFTDVAGTLEFRASVIRSLEAAGAETVWKENEDFFLVKNSGSYSVEQKLETLTGMMGIIEHLRDPSNASALRSRGLAA